jgi:hypothetical protein
VFTAAVDMDTGPSNLTFTVSNPKKGHVALSSAPAVPVRHFRQAQINGRQVLFMHTGKEHLENNKIVTILLEIMVTLHW